MYDIVHMCHSGAHRYADVVYVDWGELVSRSEGRDQSGVFCCFFEFEVFELGSKLVIPSQPVMQYLALSTIKSFTR